MAVVTNSNMSHSVGTLENEQKHLSNALITLSHSLKVPAIEPAE